MNPFLSSTFVVPEFVVPDVPLDPEVPEVPEVPVPEVDPDPDPELDSELPEPVGEGMYSSGKAGGTSTFEGSQYPSDPPPQLLA
jgi:hypothetical protein